MEGEFKGDEDSYQRLFLTTKPISVGVEAKKTPRRNSLKRHRFAFWVAMVSELVRQSIDLRWLHLFNKRRINYMFTCFLKTLLGSTESKNL